MRLGPRSRVRRSAPAIGSAVLLGGVAGYVALLVTDLGSPRFHQFRDLFIYNALLIAAACFCLARPLLRVEARLPWTLVGLGLLAWVIGDLYYEIAFRNLDEIPIPSFADAGYLTLYPLVYVGLGLMLRSRLQDMRADLWVDGLIAGLAIAAVGAALVIGLIVVAAWQPRRAVAAVRVDGFWVFALPTFFGGVALTLLVYDHFRPINATALVLSTCAVAAVIVRMTMTFRRNAALLGSSRRDAETDALTGLANRRRLLVDLESRLQAGVPSVLLMFDLDGFKAYNDAFGHPAGDALLHRLAGKLGEAAEPYGKAYRMGGDEFCVIADGDPVNRGPMVASALRALRDESEGFQISSAYGAAVLPEEATQLSEALRIADTRLYGNKDSRRASGGRQTREVLLSVLHERDADLRGHLSAVARLARPVGELLGVRDSDLQDLLLAAELHDVGKLAIPDSIL